MLEKYMQIDLTITQKFTSQYSWILYEFLKSHYQKRRLKSLTISLEDLKTAFKVQDVSSYNRNFSNFRQKVLDLAIDEINRYSELYVSYTPYYVGKSVRDIVFEWQSARIDYLATRKQIKLLKELHRELETYDSFLNDLKYSSFRQLLIESDFKQLTRNVANANIKRAQTILKELEDLESLAVSQPFPPLLEETLSYPHQLEDMVYQTVREKLSHNHDIFKNMSYVDMALLLFFNNHYSQERESKHGINPQSINLICQNIEVDFAKYIKTHHKH